VYLLDRLEHVFHLRQDLVLQVRRVRHERVRRRETSDRRVEERERLVRHPRRDLGAALEVIGKPKHVIDQRVPEILELVGLGDKLNNFPDELSGGEQQRVSIARACVNRPLVLLADEPTGNLDPNTSVDIMRLLDKVNKIGTTVVMATHDQAIVDAMRKRVIELDNGKVVRDQSRGVYS